MKALGWLVTGGLMLASALQAQPLADLQVRLVALRNEQPIRLKVDVDLRHRGSAPLHLNDTHQRGRAIVVYGSHGPEVREQRWSETGNRFSVWRQSKVEVETPLVGEAEAGDLVDPAGMLALLLRGATLLAVEAVTWQGQPARLLTIQPGPFVADGAKTTGSGPERFVTEAKIWLDAGGSPLALERSMAVRLGNALQVMQRQTLTFQQVEGRLLAARSEETYSGTALAVLSSTDEKKMKITVD
ncbi:MAG TPA: hypothetical protein VF173_02415 [Thermoanaerobaculia bacterium]|nr:hypothetical protein [Thermoanaerobaculia bacterium]